MTSISYANGVAAVLGILFGMANAVALACSSSRNLPADAGPLTNHALAFNGATDYAQAGNANFVASSSPQTISLWVSFPANDAGTAEEQDFISLQRDIQSGLHIGIKDGKLAAWRQYEDPKEPPLVEATLPPAGWHHVAYVLEVDYVHHVYTNTLYINGKVIDTSTVVPNNLTPSLVFIGNSFQQSGYTNFFAGDLDEIRIWNVARTAVEVQEEMRGEVRSIEPGLVAYFNCNLILDGGLLPDNSGNGNNALLGGGDPEDMPTLLLSNRPQPRE
jgi:hypothetical protein